MDKGKKREEQENAVGPESGRLEQVIRYSLLTLTGIADRIKELDPSQEKNLESLQQRPNNLLDPAYTRPWWTIFAGGLRAIFRVQIVWRQTE